MTMSKGTERLAHAYVERQGLDRDRAFNLASEVDGDPEVMNAALEWVETANFAELPDREGYSPAKLKAYMSPTGVFSTLVRLRTRPEQTLRFLRRDRASLIAMYEARS